MSIIDQLLLPSVCRVGNVGGLVQSWEWGSVENKGLNKEAAEHRVHGILPLKEGILVEQLVIAIFNGVPHQVDSGRQDENLRRVKMRSFGLLKMIVSALVTY